jgi:hypothetical protein
MEGPTPVSAHPCGNDGGRSIPGGASLSADVGRAADLLPRPHVQPLPSDIRTSEIAREESEVLRLRKEMGYGEGAAVVGTQADPSVAPKVVT